MSTKFKIISFQFTLLAAGLLIVEFVLRQMGYKPADLKPNWLNFKPVDSLYLIPDFHADSEGILIADSVYWSQSNIHINSQGFRAKQFSQLDSSKKKILFIGDSFTWGMTVNPFPQNCFADILTNETNYEIINFGIPVADPVQYTALAKKYVPQLQPDLVFVFFFMGNDLMQYDRKIIPGEAFYYYTNAGAILADEDSFHFKNEQEAYNYFANEKYYLHQPKNIFERIISKSALLSRLYSLRFRTEEKIKFERTVKDAHITKKYLREIQQICANSKAPLKFVLIPEIKEADMSIEKYSQKYADLLRDDSLKADWLFVPNKKSNFNDYPDGHLNNQGHRAYADFLKNFLNDFFQGE